MRDHRSQQLHFLNKRPLNLAAKQWLLKTPEEPDPSYQHLYQLLLWGLNQELRNSLASPYREFLEKLAVQEDQEAAYRYLVVDPQLGPEEPRLDPEDLTDQGSLKAVVALLMDKFKDALTSDESLRPSYPPATEPN